MNTEVLIVGAGPSGLMMACQLAIQGVDFRIVEKRKFRSVHSGALILQARTLEIFQQMGLADEAVKRGQIAGCIHLLFNGKEKSFLRIDQLGQGYSEFPFLLMLKQDETELLLKNFLLSKKIEVEYQKELAGLEMDDRQVVARVKTGEGSDEIITCRYLIAADGSHSFIRNQLQIPFIGSTYELALYVMDVDATNSFSQEDIYFSFAKNTNAGFFPLRNNKWRIDGMLQRKEEGDSNRRFDQIKRNFSQDTKLNVHLKQADWFSIFRSHQFVATEFQKGRCFLIGDAAHVHSPIGAQGMNTGMQDAYNLAWKLAFVIKKKADEALLKSYDQERTHIARKVIKSTDTAFRFITSHHYFFKKIRLWLVPVLSKTLFTLIKKNQKVRHYFFKHLSETGIHYRWHRDYKNKGEGQFPKYSPKPGERFPFILLTINGQPFNIQHLFKGGTFHLLILSSSPLEKKHICFLEKNQHFMTYSVLEFSACNRSVYSRLTARNEAIYLLRPDMYIAFRSEVFDIKKLTKTITNLFHIQVN
jgi:2-polyprenyl-6-methoxyphenol hydroxylase-like FAD-dependent oxidoreductase